MSGLSYRHQRVQRLRRLLGRRSARKDEGRFVIEGVNLLEEALAAGASIEAVYVDGGALGRKAFPMPMARRIPVAATGSVGSSSAASSSGCRCSSSSLGCSPVWRAP